MNRPLALTLAAALVPAVASAQPAPDQPTQNNAPSQQNNNPIVVVPNGNTTNNTNNNNNNSNNNPSAPPPVVTTEPASTVVVPTATPAPQSDVVYDRWNMPVFMSGALAFGASYGAAAIASGASNHPGADRLVVPLAGPWLALSDWGHCPITSPDCDHNTTDKVLLVVDGVFQAAGLVTMLDGLLDPSSHHGAYVRTAQKGIHVAPTGTGIKVFGAF